MKKAISTIIEVVAFSLLLIGGVFAYPERLESVNSLVILCVSIGVAIILSKVFEYAIQRLICKKVIQSKCMSHFLSIMLCATISFGLFFASFSVTERVAMMPASTRTLLILSSLSAVTHIGISKAFDSLVGVKQVCFFKKIFKCNCNENGSQAENNEIN